jgi:alpha-D-xyloside xylohydrolase
MKSSEVPSGNEIINYRQDNNTLFINSRDYMLEITAVTPSIIHSRYTGRDEFSSKKSMMIVENSLIPPECSIREYDDKLVFLTEHVQLEINRDNLAFVWRDADGKLLVKEPDKGGKYLMETPVYKSYFDEKSKITANLGVDGIQAKVEPAGYREDRKAYSTKLEFVFNDGEAIYGLGQGNQGILNYRDRYRYLYQQNMNIACPMFISTNGYGFLWDSYSLGVFHDDHHGSYYWTEIDDEMDFYFMYGPGFDEIITCYRQLTGQVPMLPRWAYGYVQSKERYKTQQELLDIVDEYRKRHVPLDCIVQDWRYWEENYWGEKWFDKTRYPDPGKLMDDLHKRNVKLMISIWPNMNGNGPNQRQLVENKCMLGNNSTYNPFMKKAREIFWEQCYEGIFKYGLDSWWCDCAEPFENDWHGASKRPPYKHMIESTSEFKKYMDPEHINAFSLKHSQGIYEGQRKVSSKRVVNLTRSHYPGQQRYGTVVWSGDISSTWDTMRKQIAEGLNFTASGAPKWTLDIGGFFVSNNDDLWFMDGEYDNGCDDMGFRELYVRWFQYGAFLPMFRSHGTNISREVWNFGEKGERFYDTLVDFINLRYRLLPYIYSISGWETHRSYTMLRNLAFDLRHDRNVYDISDQYMFGPAIMVCPVTSPMYYDRGSLKLQDIAKERKVYLPSGYDWYDFWTGIKYNGGQDVAAPAPIEKMPLFVKAGSIIPMGPFIQHTGETNDESWELRIYGGADGAFDIYEDSGDGYEYEKGEFAWTSITWNDNHNVLEFDEREGSFTGMAVARNFKVVKVSAGHGTGIQYTEKYDTLVKYDGGHAAIPLPTYNRI